MRFLSDSLDAFCNSLGFFQLTAKTDLKIGVFCAPNDGCMVVDLASNPRIAVDLNGNTFIGCYAGIFIFVVR